MVWNLEEVAVKPFAYFYNEILMVLNFQEAAVKPFKQVSNNKKQDIVKLVNGFTTAFRKFQIIKISL